MPTVAGTDPDVAELASRSCAGCTLCCWLPDIEVLDKPANVRCRHCVAGQGCSAYQQRPRTCRDFLCLWRTDPSLDAFWNPLTARMMAYRQGPQTTVLIDPEHPDLLQAPAHRQALSALARTAETSGGYLIVFLGDHVARLRPDDCGMNG